MPTTATAPDRRSWQWRIFALTWIAYAGFYLCRKHLAVAMPLLAGHFGYTRFDFARVLLCDSIVYAAAQIAFGLAADRYGARRVVALGLGLTVAASLAMAQAGTLGALALLAGLNGLGQAAGWPGLVKHVGDWFPRRTRGVVMAWWSTNYMAGGFAGTALTAWIATHPTLWVSLGWRRAFLVPALALAAISILYVLLTRDKPSDAGLDTPIDAPVEEARGAAALHGMLRDPEVWAIAAGSLISKVTRYTFMFWLPLYAVQQLHYTPRDAGLASSLFELAAPLGSLLAGYVSDRLMRSRRLPVAAAMFAALALACWFHPRLAATGAPGLLIGIALLGILNHGPDALLQGAAAQDLGGRWGVGLVAGFVSGFATLGQILAPLTVAFVTDRYGWDRLFQCLAAIALAGAMLPALRLHRARAR